MKVLLSPQCRKSQIRESGVERPVRKLVHQCLHEWRGSKPGMEVRMVCRRCLKQRGVDLGADLGDSEGGQSQGGFPGL